MKLLKLSGNSSEFTNIWNNEIRLPEKSKIGLVSASMKLKDELITIDDTNNSFYVKTSDRRPLEIVTLQEGTYNIKDFVSEINRALNASLGIRTNQLPNLVLDNPNFQWKSILTSDNKLKIQFSKGTYNISLELDDNHRHIMDNPSAGTFTKTTAQNDWRSFGYTPDFFINGSGQASCVIAGGLDFCFGLLKEQPEAGTDTLSPENYDYCVYHRGTNLYTVAKDGESTNTEQEPHAGDKVRLMLYGGKLNVVINDQTLIYSWDWDYTTSYHLAFSIWTPNGQLTNVIWTPDPYQKTTADEIQYHHELSSVFHAIHTLGALLGARPKPSKPRIDLRTNLSLVNIMGYIETIIQFDTGINGSRTANESIPEANIPNIILIELLGLNIESFDGKESKKRPIVAYIPSYTMNANLELTYNVNFPIFLDIDNVSSQNLNRLTIRLISLESTETIPLVNEVSLLFLVGQ